MGYESKVYICNRISNDVYTYNEVIAAVDMRKMGYDTGWRDLFTKKLDGDFFGFDHDNPRYQDWTDAELLDAYDEPMMYADIDTVKEWVDDQIINGDDYRRLFVLKAVLDSFDKPQWESDRAKLIVAHYGYYGESKLAGKAAFNSDFNFNLYEFFHFCHKMLKKDDTKNVPRGRSSNSSCMIVFCSFEQTQTLIAAAKKHGFVHYIPLVFIKNYSPQVLKANMRVVGATEYALVLYRNKLPKFRNGLQIDENGKNIRGTGHMVFNWFKWEKDGKDVPKIHPAQKPVNVIEQLINIFTDPGDVVIDPCCGSGTTLRAARNLGRSSYGFEIDRNFYQRAKDEMLGI